MPLKAGKEHVDENIRELMDAYEQSGKIGDTRPRSRSHAHLIAVAIAMKESRKGN